MVNANLRGTKAARNRPAMRTNARTMAQVTTYGKRSNTYASASTSVTMGWNNHVSTPAWAASPALAASTLRMLCTKSRDSVENGLNDGEKEIVVAVAPSLVSCFHL